MTELPIVSRQADVECLRVTLHIREDLGWFRGHFPEIPVLPGIVQLHWAVQLAKEHFDLKGEPFDIQRLKFKSVACPPLVMELLLTRKSVTDVHFAYSGPGRQYSEGRLKFPGHSE